jgi:Zinc-finger associated domain (zf-AD)/Zinc finger, C2H2 type
MTLNLVNSCRCCLSSDEDDLLAMFDSLLFDECVKTGQNLTVIQSYFELCVDSVNATLGPFNICSSCRRILQTFATFREQCRANNGLFQNNSIKTEIAETPSFNVIVNERKVSTHHLVTEVLISEVKSEPPSQDEDEIPLARRVCLKNETETKTTSQTNDANFLCLYCDERFGSCDAFKTHLRERVRYCTITGIYKCGICGEKNVKNYAYHLHTQHATHKHQQCLICSEKFITPAELLNHMAKHQNPDFTYKCHGTGCSKWFTSDHARRKHIESFEHNPSTPKRSPWLTFNCPICGLTGALQSLARHIRDAHSQELTHKYYPCYACRRIFLLSTDFDRHQRKGCPFEVAHTGKQKRKKTQRCGKCDFECAEEEELVCHDLVEHNVVEETFSCPFCPETFDTAADLVHHKRVQHRSCNLDNTHICEQCGRGFSNISQYKAHVMTQ